MEIRIEFKNTTNYQQPHSYYFNSSKEFIPNIGERVSVDESARDYYIVVERRFDYGKDRVVLEVEPEKSGIKIDNSKNHPDKHISQDICRHRNKGVSTVDASSSRFGFGKCTMCGKEVYIGKGGTK